MKYAIIIPDGCADEPQESLDGRTPLQAARLPAMDQIAAEGIVGRSQNVPQHLPAGSAVANMSLLGYDPIEHFTGRAPLEAAAQGVELGPEDWAIRCNLVTVDDQMMRDFTAGHISTDEASGLLATAQQEVGEGPLTFVTGVSYRNLLIYRGEQSPPPFSKDTRTAAPHDLIDQSVADHYPRGPGSDLLNDLMSRSVDWFAEHEVNVARRKQDRRVATNMWLWGQGKTPQLPLFASAYGLQGCMITAVDLLRGLAALIGWRRIEVEGATGYIDTDYAAKGRAAVEALQTTDVTCVHIEAPDEASHEGNVQAKIESLQQIDEHIVGPLVEALKSCGEYRVLVSPDHPTPVRTKMHSHGFVPWAVAGAGIEPDGAATYDEQSAGDSEVELLEGWRLMQRFVGQ